MLEFNPTQAMFDAIYAHLGRGNREAHKWLFLGATRAQNKSLILQIVNEIDEKADNEDIFTQAAVFSLCSMANVHLLDTVIKKFDPNIFYRFALPAFIKLRNFDLFVRYVADTNTDSFGWNWMFTQAVEHGSLKIAQFCFSNGKSIINELIIREAYQSGEVAMVEWLKEKAAPSSINMNRVAIDYLGQFTNAGGSGFITLNVTLLNELLSTLGEVIKSYFLKSCVKNLVLVHTFRYKNVTDDVFRVFAHYAPDLEIPFPRESEVDAKHVLSVLKYFKKTMVPNNVFTETELLEMIRDGILEHSQFACNLTPKQPKLHLSVLNLLSIKRTVYLFFATETELRDNAELILEYL